MNKFTLVIDGNYLLYSTLSVMKLFSKNNEMFLKGNNEETLRKDTNFLLEKLTQIYAKDIRSLGPIIDDVIFTIDDSNSWRKDLYLTKDYKGIQTGLSYKGNRKKDKGIDFSSIFNVFDSFVKGLAISCNLNFKAIPGCEADDLIFVHCSYLNTQGKSTIIYSGDGDLKQCVGFDKSKNTFTIQYQKQNRKIWIDRDTALYLKENQKTYAVDCLRSVVNNTSSKLSVVDPFEIVIEKVLGGDISDNIVPIISEARQYGPKAKKAGQWFNTGIADATIKNIKKEIDFSKFNVEDLFRTDFKRKLASSAIRNFKSQNKYSIEDVENNVDVNINLVLLHKQTIPSYLYNDIFNWSEETYKKKKCEVQKQFNYKQLLLSMKLYDKKAHDNSSSASIFKELGL